MRAVLAVTALCALALSGCVADASDADSPFAFGRSCSEQTQFRSSTTPALLMPGEAPSGNPRVSIEVEEGQTLTASAAWRLDAGRARVTFDGPTQHVVEADGGWTATTGRAPAGTYTLGLDGAPLAASGMYSLVLTAGSCAAT